MSNLLELVGGTSISCVDGICGTLGRMIVDPATKKVTHLSVEPEGLLDNGRLVPIGLVRAQDSGLDLRCTLTEFAGFAANSHARLLPVPGIRPGSMSMTWVTLLEVPDGEVEVNGDETILATDGHIGHLRGLVIDAADASVSTLLLEIGHFSSKRQVAIPAESLHSIDADGMHLGLSKDDIARFA